MRLIEQETAINTLERYGVATGFGTYLLERLPTIDPVHAAGGCYCHECEISGHCRAEDTFHFARKDNPFCCVGKVKGKENG